MPRGTKRKAEEQEEGPDALQFADDFCNAKRLCASHFVGSSPLEKACMQYADLARQAYKERRDDPNARQHEPSSERSASPKGGVVADDSVLTPAQKYSRRLKNNRKSAAASKVYTEVLRRAQASALQNRLPDIGGVGGGDGSKVRELQAENDRLMEEVARLKATAMTEKKMVMDLQRDRTRLQARISNMRHNYDRLRGIVAVVTANRNASQSVAKTEDFRVLEDSGPALQMSTQEFEIVNTQMAPNPALGANATQQSFGYSQPSASHYLNDSVAASQPQPMSESQPTINDSQPQGESQNQPPSSMQRLVVEKHSSSLALSNVGNESDAKAFTTGMTCTQSQGDDADDRALGRISSLPMSSSSLPISSSGLPPLLPSSQPSQELDPEFFLSSQGNSQGKSN